MFQKYPTNMINYIDSKGNVVTDAIIRSIQVRSEDDIENNVIKNPAPGDRAYLPDESKVWIFGADGEQHQKATSGSGGSGDGGGSSGRGITAIECELIADYSTQTYALTHADQLKAALDDMAENPTHGFNYAVYFRGNHELSMLGFASVAYTDPLSFGFMTIGTTEIVAARIDNSIGAEEVDISYQVTDHYSFQATDIDENGTATMMYIGD